MKRRRSYTLRKRADSQAETRRRIVEATMQLHEELGPRATTISAIAERAGVQRLTVYRHFPDETAVFQACTAHWLTLNPPPDPTAWTGIGESSKRVTAALAAFYAYYRETRRMWDAAHRDESDVPALQGPMSEFRGFLDGIARELATAVSGGRKPDRALAATMRHLLAFPTWASLADAGLSDKKMAELGRRWTEAAAR